MSWYGDAWDSFKNWWSPPSAGGKVPMPDTGWSGQANKRYDRFANQGTPDLGAAALSQGGGQFRNQQGSLADLLMQRAHGQGLVSDIQARQGADEAVRAQQAMMASAQPGQGAAALRMGMQNAGNVMSGLAGQRALAGAQESQMAAGQAGGVLQGARGLDIQNNQFNAAAQNQRGLDQAQLEMMRRQQLLASLGQQGGMNMGLSGMELQRNMGVAGLDAGASTGWDKLMQAGATAGGLAFRMSDERVKTEIEDGGPEADEFLAALQARKFRYKNPRHGRGKKLGIMAQDLERSRAGRRAVVETPEGKAVDFGELAPTLTASLARLNQRLRKVEEGK